MDLPLQRLQRCHLWGNSPECSHTRRAQVLAAAAPAAAPNPLISLTQRALLQAARRNKVPQRQVSGADPQQQVQHKAPPELRNSLFRVNQLVNTSPAEFEQVMEEHQRRQQQRMRQQLQQQGHVLPAAQQHAGSVRQAVQPPQTPQRQQQQQQPAAAQADSQDQLQQQRLLQQHLALRQLIAQQQQRKRQLLLQIRREPAVLTALIKRSTSWQRLQQLFTSFTPLFNPVHVSAAITHLAQLQEQPLDAQQLAQAPTGFQQLVQDLTAAAVACIPDYGPRQVANSLWAISWLGADSLLNRKLRNAFMSAFTDKLQYAAPQHVANMAAAVANMEWPASIEWGALILQAAAVRLQYFKPAELAILLHAVARLDAKPSQAWMSSFVAACYSHMYSFSLQELSMLAVSMVRLQYVPERGWLVVFLHATQLHLAPVAAGSTFMTAAAAAANGDGGGGGDSGVQAGVDQDDHLGALQLGAAVDSWSAGQGSRSFDGSGSGSTSGDTLGHAGAVRPGSDGASGPSNPLHFSEDHSVLSSEGFSEGGFLPSSEDTGDTAAVGVQGLVNITWALAKWGAVPPDGWQACCWAAADQLQEELTVQGVSTLLWSAARLQLQVPQQLLLQMLQHCQTLLPAANATDLAMLSWALGTSGVTAAALYTATPAEEDALVASNGSSHVAADPAGAVQGAVSDVGPWQRGHADSTSSNGSAAPDSHTSFSQADSSRHSSSGSSNSNGSSGRPRRAWGACWLSDYLYHSYRAMPTATAADVSSLLVGAVRMRLSPGPKWLGSVLVEAMHKLPDMNPVQLTSTLQCLARLHCRPRQSFLEAYCQASQPLLAATAAAARRTQRGTRIRVLRLRDSTAGPADSNAGSNPAQGGMADMPGRLDSAPQHFTPQSLANTLGALAMLGYHPPEAWRSSFFAATRAVMPCFTGRDFAYTMWALAVLQLQPPRTWLDAYLVQLRGHVPDMTSQQLSAVIWGLARLNHRPGVDWMNRFLDRVVALTPQPRAAPGGGGGELCSCAAVGGGSGSSTDGASMLAPRSPLQLSGYFSAIILQGLTAWAASCLELGFDGSSDGSSSSGGGSSRPATAKSRGRRAKRTKAGLTTAGAPASECAAVVADDSQSVADSPIDQTHSRTITSDGCIMFRF